MRSLAQRLEPDLIVASGDFTQRAKTVQFEAAAEFLRSLEPPTVVTPGNHDLPLWRIFERAFSPYGKYRRYISEELDSVCRRPGMTVVSLNSSRPYHITNGRLGRDQLEFAAQAFEGSDPEDLRVVVTHHHLAPPPDFAGGQVMPRARRAIEAFTAMRVDLILAGHMHRSYIGDSLDFFPGGDRENGIVIVQCGTTTSGRGRGRERLKNSLNVIRASGTEIRVAHYLWRNAQGDFWPHSEHRFGSRSSVWLKPHEARAIGSREVRT